MITYAAPCLKPSFIPAPKRLRGSKAAGLRYERALAKALPKGVHGQWFHYIKGGEPFWCQTDLLLIGSKRILVIEVKLTDYFGAQAQLLNKYLPVLRVAYPEHKVFGMIALRHLSATPADAIIFDEIKGAVEALPSLELPPVVHWLGGAAPL